MYVTVTRKSIVAAIAVLLLTVAVCSRFSAAGIKPENGATNIQRVEFIRALGINAEEECTETAEITIPARFGDVYIRYNALQKQAGYDLSLYAGCRVTRYTYTFADTPDKRVNLLVYKGRIIGGDISDTALGGGMTPLQKQEKKE